LDVRKESIAVAVAEFGRAELAGRNPGGMVMVHGQPTGGGDAALQQLVSQWDGSEGCIASA
jgi:murein L,D-transpeptidase YafK